MSPTDRSPRPLSPALKHYDWGHPTFLSRTLGLTEERIAEAWFGAHPAGPATVDGASLDGLLDERPAWLGEAVHARFGGLPYLVKLLAAGRPLSVQVHPSVSQAQAGFHREESQGLARDAAERAYRDPNHKPELLVALTPFTALAGFRPPSERAAALEALPELARRLPPLDARPESTRALLEAWFDLPEPEVTQALTALLERLAAEAPEAERPLEDPARWALFAHRTLFVDRPPDRGLLFVFLLELVRLEPRQAILLPAGAPHAYLEGAAVEVMASSDNVLRAGLTAKPIRPRELLEVVRYDALAPPVLSPVPVDRSISRYPTAAPEFTVHRVRADEPVVVPGPEDTARTVLVPEGTAAVEVRSPEGTLRLVPGQACLLPAGCRATLLGEGPTEAIVTTVGLGPDPALARASAVVRNIDFTRALLARGQGPALVGTVSGSAGARRYWAARLGDIGRELGSTVHRSLHEDLPVNQAFGLLLMWQRLRDDYRPHAGALMAFVFGEGSRSAPWTEAEMGQKPAIASFARVVQPDGSIRRPSIVELALRFFSPVEAYLRRSGFDGVVVKWGDEIQIPTLDLSGSDRRLGGADVVRFVSVQPITEDTARNKDWVGVDSSGAVTAFIPRRPLAEMEPLADRGVFRRDPESGALLGGINLGSVALSRPLLDALLEEFEAEVNDPAADRRRRPDLDPQLFTALCIANLPDPAERAKAWSTAQAESASMRTLETNLPGVLDRLRGVVERFEAAQGRPVRIEALDFGDQYWGDIGQHPKIFEFFAALRDRGPTGFVARALGGLEGTWDAQGNLRIGEVRLGPKVEVRDSVLIDVRIDEGLVERSVLVGTQAVAVKARGAVDVESVAPRLDLAERAGTYRVLSEQPVTVRAGERLTTVTTPDAALHLRVDEGANLRDRAASYDVPVGDNPVSFAEARARVLAADPEALARLRAERRATLLDRLFTHRPVP